MDVQPRLLRYFLAVAEELHFGRAASRLYISQPSLSNQIRKLESTLGTPLFVRSSRRVELTAAGKALFVEAPVALAALDRATEQTRLAGSSIRASLRLGYTPISSADTLPALLAALDESDPGLIVIAREYYSAEIPERLRAGDIDIGLAMSPPTLEGINSEPIREEPIAALFSAGHRLASATSIALGDLRDETLMLFPRQLAPSYYDDIISACETAGFQPRVCAFDDPPVSAMLARLPTGREIALTLASCAAYGAGAAPDLVARPVVDPAIDTQLAILWTAGTSSAIAENFLDVARVCAAQRSWLHTPTGAVDPTEPARSA